MRVISGHLDEGTKGRAEVTPAELAKPGSHGAAYAQLRHPFSSKYTCATWIKAGKKKDSSTLLRPAKQEGGLSSQTNLILFAEEEWKLKDSRGQRLAQRVFMVPSFPHQGS